MNWQGWGLRDVVSCSGQTCIKPFSNLHVDHDLIADASLERVSNEQTNVYRETHRHSRSGLRGKEKGDDEAGEERNEASDPVP